MKWVSKEDLNKMNDPVELKLYDPMSIQIETDDWNYVNTMKEEFTRMVPNFQFMPKYRSGMWNGRTCMINSFNRTLPYGLLADYIRIHKRNFSRKLIIDKEIKKIYKGKDIDVTYDFSLYPRPYQKDCIESCLKISKGIIRSATASGKSLVIAYIIMNLLNNNAINKSIIIVPSKTLIRQFHENMLEYEIPKEYIGEYWADKKEPEKKIVISTWQSLSRKKNLVNEFGCVIVDEVHGAKAFQLKKILSNSKNAKYRLGFTGTMHSAELDNWNVKSYLGPVIRDYPAGLLAEEGWISKCTVNMMRLNYNREEWFGSYHEVKQEVFENPFRLNKIREIVKELDHNVLLLVGKVEAEGDLLKEYLTKSDCGKQVEFISGRDSVDEREKWRKECMKRKDIALIATYGIYQQGVDIPNLKYVILVSPFKSKIRVLQSIGRSLRKHSDKEGGAQIFDIHDNIKYFKDYDTIRIRYYDKEKFKVNEEEFDEKDDTTYCFE